MTGSGDSIRVSAVDETPNSTMLVEGLLVSQTIVAELSLISVGVGADVMTGSSTSTGMVVTVVEEVELVDTKVKLVDVPVNEVLVPVKEVLVPVKEVGNVKDVLDPVKEVDVPVNEVLVPVKELGNVN